MLHRFYNYLTGKEEEHQIFCDHCHESPNIGKPKRGDMKIVCYCEKCNYLMCEECNDFLENLLEDMLNRGLFFNNIICTNYVYCPSCKNKLMTGKNKEAILRACRRNLRNANKNGQD